VCDGIETFIEELMSTRRLTFLSFPVISSITYTELIAANSWEVNDWEVHAWNARLQPELITGRQGERWTRA
jgi:hypothetical protein